MWLDEVDGGIISRYEILDGNPVDHEQVKPSLDHYLEVFNKAPVLLTADQGTHSVPNEECAEKKGIKQVVLPKPGKKSAAREAYEKQRWFWRGRKWRSGIEGRISLLKRRHQLKRCRNHGEKGMERWVGWGVIAHDLWMMAQATVN